MKEKYPNTIPASFKYVITRKEHLCSGCSNKIPSGSKALFDSGRVMGYWFKEWFCQVNICDFDRIDSIPDEDLKDKLLRERILQDGS